MITTPEGGNPDTIPELLTFRMSALVSAGPRKAPSEVRDLGEDVAGIAQQGDLSAFWLADGTSDEMSIEGFSTRRLAQELGEAFFDVAFDSDLASHSKCLTSNALAEELCRRTLSRWQHRFLAFWSGLENAERNTLLDRLPSISTGARGLTWSLVFVGALIDTRKNKAWIIHCGDCFAFIFTSAEDLHCVGPHASRLFLRLRIATGDDQPDITFLANAETFLSLDMNNISAFVALTDGVARKNEVLRYLKQNPIGKFSDLVGFLKGRPPGLDDDRGMVIGCLPGCDPGFSSGRIVDARQLMLEFRVNPAAPEAAVESPAPAAPQAIPRHPETETAEGFTSDDFKPASAPPPIWFANVIALGWRICNRIFSRARSVRPSDRNMPS